MAPRGRRTTEVAEEPQVFHEFGIRGRKTGVALPNAGKVDDEGFQPLEDVFSSPQKAPQADSRGAADDEDEEEEEEEDDTGSEDMDIASSAGPGPRTLLKEQRSLQYPLPRSRSPIKTTLLSPARRNPHLDRLSSPAQEDRDLTVTRKLNFAQRAAAKANAASRTNGVNGGAVAESDAETDDGDADVVQDIGDDDDDVEADESMQMVGAIQDDPDDPPTDDEEPEVAETEPEDDDEPIVEETQPVKRARGRPRTSLPKEPEAEDSVKKPRGRPKGAKKLVQEEPEEAESHTPRGSKKRRSLRSSLGSDGGEEQQASGEEPEEEPRQAKRQRTEQKLKPKQIKKPLNKATSSAKPSLAAKPVETAPPKPKAKAGRPAKPKTIPEDAGETSFMALQKGPPMPKRRGLVSVKRDPDVIVQTRAGRQSFRPLHWWAGDKVVTEVEEREDMFRGKSGFVTESTKEVFRAVEEEAPTKRGPRSRGRAKTKTKNQPQQIEEDEDPPEEWELDRGIIEGEVMEWEPSHEKHPPAEDDQVNVSEELLAISAEAVQTKDIKDATFRFAKTLTMPFMGAGIVDLPPGAEKRPKNSRKMHMVFFVHTGKVLVTVNETEFRISAGGQWFVPRGNYYSITNDNDKDARIFFSQANDTYPYEIAEEEE